MVLLNTANKVYFGTTAVDKVYQGTNLVWSGAYKDTVLADGPVIYWRLDETAGPTAADLSGHGNNGTYAGAPLQFSQPGALGHDTDTAVNLNNGGYISSAWPYPVGGTLSIEGWSKTPAAVTPGGLLICSTVNGAVPNLYWDSPIQLAWYPRNAAALFWPIPRAQWPLGVWMHWVLTWDDTARVGRFYLNGVDQGGGTWESGTAQSFGTPYNFEVGAVAAGIAPWPGFMDEIAVYPSILSAARVAAHYQAGT